MSELPKGWVETTLGEVATVQTGPFGSQLHNRDYVEVGTPIITVEHIVNDRINHSSEIPKVSNNDKQRLSKYLLKEGDIVFSRVGSVDRSAYVSSKENGWMFSGRLLRVREKSQSTFSHFLHYLLTNQAIKKYIRKIAVGATMPSLNTAILSEIPLTLPPLPEQKAIAAVLSAFDDKIELLREQNQTLETLAQTIFKEWFVHFNFPFDFAQGKPDPNGKPYRDNGGEMVDSELGKIPKGWRVGGIRVLVQHIKKSIKPLEYSNREFLHYSLPAFDSGKRPEKQKGSEINSGKYIVAENCFLVSKLNPATPRVWVVMEASEKSICSTEFQVIKPVKFELFGFVYGALTSYLIIHELSARAHGTSGSHQRVKPEDILDCPIFIPSNYLIEKYSEITNTHLEKINENLKQIQTLSQIRDTLLPKLMNGEIRVKL